MIFDRMHIAHVTSSKLAKCLNYDIHSLQHTLVMSLCLSAVICHAVGYVPPTPLTQNQKFGERAFCVSGPTIWNSLPESFRTVTCTAIFKRHLKTLLTFFILAISLLFILY